MNGGLPSRRASRAGRLLARHATGTLRALAEWDRCQEFLARMDDYLAYDALCSAISRPSRGPEELDRMFRRDVGPLLYDQPLPKAHDISQLQ